MATAAAVSGSSLETISEEERRWVVVGICLTKVLTPALRISLHNKMTEWYESLIQPPLEINKQTFTKHIRKYPSHSEFNFNYKSINNNSSRDAPSYDYAVKDPVSLAMLFVQPFMAKFTGFDETMDTSAVLSVVAEAQPFHQASDDAKKLRSDVRNKWAHFNSSDWSDEKFQAALTDMKNLINKIDLTPSERTKTLGDLNDWKNKGVEFCFGLPRDSEQLSLFQKEVADLHESVKSWKCWVEDSQREIVHSLETAKRDWDLKQELEALKNAVQQLKFEREEISGINDEKQSSTDKEDGSVSGVDGSFHDDRQINTARDPPQDTTKLSNPEVTRFSLKMVTNYRDIAGLANLDRDEVENVNRDHINYPEPKNKAAQILCLISRRPNFSRKKLAGFLKEAGMGSLGDDLLKGTFYHDA